MPSNVANIRKTLKNTQIALETCRAELKFVKRELCLKDQQFQDLCHERDQAIQEAKELKLQLQTALTKLSHAPSEIRKTISQLTSRQQKAKRLSELKSQLGPNYKIVESNSAPDMTTFDYCAFRRLHRIPERTIIALSSFPNSNWPSLSQLNQCEKRLIEKCGGFTNENVDGVEMLWASDPLCLLTGYLQHLQTTFWSGKIPNRVKLVLSGDKGIFTIILYIYLSLGGEWVKFGFFVSTDVPKPQSPYNFCVAALYKGPETRQLVAVATAVLFRFANQLSRDGGIFVQLQNGSTFFVSIDVMFVSDLKMLPIVFGVNHSSSTYFCPLCLVSRHDHRKEASGGIMRNFQLDDNETLLDIPIMNIVCPPLHLIQGAVNTILKEMDKEK